MNRNKLFTFVIIVLFLTAFTGSSYATKDQTQIDVYDQQKSLIKSIVFVVGLDQYFVNGETTGVKMDTSPFIEKNRTFVPVRFLSNALGVDNDHILWDGSIQKVTLEAWNTVEMRIDQAYIVTNGNTKEIDVAPQLKLPGRTFLPARFVAEALGYVVDWDETNQVVLCYPQGGEKPDISQVVKYVVDIQKQQPVQPRDTFTTAAGYQIPKETKLNLPKDIKELGPGDPNNCELQFNIDLTKGGLESQWNDAAYIISQTIDSQIVDEVMSYVKQKTDWKYVLMFKRWESNGKKIGVSSPGGSDGVEITVWYK